MPKFLLTLVLTFLGASAFACPFCNKKIADGIYNSQFYPNLFTMLSAFTILAVVVAILTAAHGKTPQNKSCSCFK